MVTFPIDGIKTKTDKLVHCSKPLSTHGLRKKVESNDPETFKNE